MRIRFDPKLLRGKGSFSALAILTGMLLLFLSGVLFADPTEARWRFLIFGVPGVFFLVRGTGKSSFGRFTLPLDILIAGALFFLGMKAGTQVPTERAPAACAGEQTPDCAPVSQSPSH